MSHFTVLVVANPEDLEARLQPFHEFECTGEVDEYVKDVDLTDEVKALMTREGDAKPLALTEALEYHGLADQIVADESEVDRNGAHKWGFAVVKDGELVKAVDRTNPNRKWDWYQLGGRWSGFLKLKPGATGAHGRPGLMTSPGEAGTCDQARVGDIDWDAMLAEAGKEAGDLYDKVRAAAEGEPEYIPWAAFIKRVEDTNDSMDIDQARTEYHAQSLVVKTKSLFGFMGGGEKITRILSTDRDTFIKLTSEDNCSTYALLDADGNWHEPGVMGWFGMSSETAESKVAFAQAFWAHIRSLPADAVVSVVDCHI